MTTALSLSIGNVLPNGATILATTESSEWWTILALVQGKEFATWKVDPKTGNAEWGHYFQNIEDALLSFQTRSGNKTDISDKHTVYVSCEQVQRLAALSLDALAGMQITTDDAMSSDVTVDMVSIDDTSRTEHFCVCDDGSYSKTS